MRIIDKEIVESDKVWSDFGWFILAFCKFCQCKTMVELGVKYGDTTQKLCEAAKSTNGKVFAYDIFEAIGEYPDSPQCKLEAIESKLTSAGYDKSLFKITKINTTSDEFVKVLKEDTGGIIDFAFIDADHSYSGVRNDFMKIYPFLADDGSIMFHDTFNHTGSRRFILDLYQDLNDGTFDVISLPFGYHYHRCGLTILTKRSYPLNQDYQSRAGVPIYAHTSDVPFISTEEVFKAEREWYYKQIADKKKS